MFMFAYRYGSRFSLCIIINVYRIFYYIYISIYTTYIVIFFALVRSVNRE